MNFSKIKIDSDLAWHLILFFAITSLIFTASSEAFAVGLESGDIDEDDIIGKTICRLVVNLSGGMARGIATLAIFSVGIGLFLGKLNWSIAAATAAGVGVIFSAETLVDFLGGGSDGATCKEIVDI